MYSKNSKELIEGRSMPVLPARVPSSKAWEHKKSAACQVEVRKVVGPVLQSVPCGPLLIPGRVGEHLSWHKVFGAS